jgi:hypothetical protein
MSVPSSESGTPHPLSRKRVCPPGTKGGGTDSAAGGGGGPNSDNWRKSIGLCLLCGPHAVNEVELAPSNYSVIISKSARNINKKTHL